MNLNLGLYPPELVVGMPANITLTTSDSGDFYVELLNQCTTQNFECIPGSSQAQVLDSAVEFKMIPLGNGTYFYPVIPERPGNITMRLKKYEVNGTCYRSLMNQTFSGQINDCKNMKIKAPITGNVSFELKANQSAEVFHHGQLFASAQDGGSFYFVFPMDKDELYDTQIHYVKSPQTPFFSLLYWSYSGSNFTEIPESYLYAATIVGSDLNVSIGCVNTSSFILHQNRPTCASLS